MSRSAAPSIRVWPLVALASVALGTSAAPVEVPRAAGRVTDLADLLERDRHARIEATLEHAEEDSGLQIFVLTLPTLGGDSLEDFSVRTARAWQVGRGEQDDGVLMLVVRDDRRLRLEVGYGLEARLTDLDSARILEEVVAPRLRAGAPGEAIEAGIAAVLAHLGAAGAEEARASPMGIGARLALALAGGSLLLFASLRVACAAAAGAWFAFAVFLLPMYAFFAGLAPPSMPRGRVALAVVVAAGVAFVAGRVFVRHTRRGRRWAKSSRVGRVLGAAEERERPARGEKLSRERTRATSWREGGFSGGGGDFGGGGASTKW